MTARNPDNTLRYRIERQNLQETDDLARVLALSRQDVSRMAHALGLLQLRQTIDAAARPERVDAA